MKHRNFANSLQGIAKPDNDTRYHRIVMKLVFVGLFFWITYPYVFPSLYPIEAPPRRHSPTTYTSMHHAAGRVGPGDVHAPLHDPSTARGGVRHHGTAATGKDTVFDFSVMDANNALVSLSKYKGKALLIVNVASNCGYTKSGYSTMVQLHRKFKDHGFEVLAFPCNQFGGQEPGTAHDVVEFAHKTYDAEFPIFGKIDVNGADQHPLYRLLTNAIPGILGTRAVKWNFTFFLVDKEGVPVERFSPGTATVVIETALRKLLF